jgi:glycopeptide antibiotics resistance protein
LQKTAAMLLALYLLLLLYLTLVFHAGPRFPRGRALELVPLRTTAHFLRAGGWEMVVNVVGNVAAFMPLGVLVPLARGARTSVRRVVLTGAGLSLAIEAAQFASGRRVADVDDVLLNTAGTLLGYGVLALGLRWRSWVRASRGAVAE